MTYPGQTVTFDSSSYLDASNPDCIDLTAQYGTMWTDTVVNQDPVVQLYYENDPFGILGSLISISTEITVNGVTNGVIGM